MESLLLREENTYLSLDTHFSNHDGRDGLDDIHTS